MNPTLVIQPAFAFAQLEAALARLGWERAANTSVAPPIIAGEPEFASWSRARGDDEEGRDRISYTFNPVVHLRVLVFYGERAAAHHAEVADALPALGLSDLRRLLEVDDPRTLLLGVFAARELRAFQTLDLLEALRTHAHATVAAAARQAHAEIVQAFLETGAERLREEKRQHPGRSVLFPHLGDAHVRRQTLRWLMRDYSKANEHIVEVLRSGLVDEDWEVRATAMLAAARLGARDAIEDVRRVELPRTSRDGLDETDRTILFAAREVVLSILAGKPAPGEDAADEEMAAGDDQHAALSRHLWRCVAGEPVERRDRVFQLINALTEPDEIEEEDEPPGPPSS